MDEKADKEAKLTQIEPIVFYANEFNKANSGKNMEELLSILQKLSLARDLETIMYIVRRTARSLTHADGATFVLRDKDQCYYADEEAIAPLWKGKRFPMEICVSGWVMKHREAIVIEDIYSDSRVPADAYRPTFVKSLAMVPIRSEDPIGAIGTYWAENYLPSEEQVNLLKTLADATSVAMVNVQLHSQLEVGSKKNSTQIKITNELLNANKALENTLTELNRRNEEMQLLKDFSSLLQTCLNIDEAYQLITQYIQKLLHNVAGAFYIMHPSRNYLEAMASWGSPLLEEKIIKPEECLSLRRGSMYKIEHPEKELICGHFKSNKKLRSYACIPLFVQSDILGLFYLEWKNNEKSNLKTKDNQLLLASMIAEQIAIGISNIQLRETLRNQSFRDVLTGLYNRRFLEETLEREMSRSKRNAANLALLMIDIDHFKQFNDNFGHEAGDIVIQAFAKVLQNVRKGDMACRFGGEEFILILPEITLEDAKKRAEEYHEALAQVHLNYAGITLPQITMSIGLALYPLHAATMNDLIAASDMALYRAKNSGRNRTIVYDKVVS